MLEWSGWQFLSWTWSLVESCSLCSCQCGEGGERFTSYQSHSKSLSSLDKEAGKLQATWSLDGDGHKGALLGKLVLKGTLPLLK